ncbi:hypothetical protein GLYMA_05G111200v4 [Glycine max]|uniref:Uncharacterized protein n=2 Tax=Glycine subgen. Soja TaxID=1462606 RepID=K7KPL0_SOYBN|nr:hypothetical protein GYH30_012308 [Glycine max]KRH58193.1 hypothetical protein GLYMA_05G111200v4 [Glycine max]RZC11977.1 hypothetical protein D0Y65_011968 [Glycine soja]
MGIASLPLMGSPKFTTFRDLYQYTITHQPSQSFEFEMEEKSRSCNVCDTWHSFSLYVHIEQVAATAVWGLMTLLIKPMKESEPVSALLRQHLVLCSVEYRMQL